MPKPKPKFYVPDSPDDAGQDIDWSKAQRVVFPNLKPATTTI